MRALLIAALSTALAGLVGCSGSEATDDGGATASDCVVDSTIILAIERTDRLDMGMDPESGIAIRISPAPQCGKTVHVDVDTSAASNYLTVTPTSLAYGDSETEKTVTVTPKQDTSGKFVPVKFKVRGQSFERTLDVRVTDRS